MLRKIDVLVNIVLKFSKTSPAPDKAEGFFVN
jgi:hypothetical protein